MSNQSYTIADLLALPDDALNVLAAELRGWHAKYFIDGTGFWCGGGKILYAVVIGSLTHEDWPGDPQGITRPRWSPADDRNQSGELLTLATAQGLGFMVDWFGVGDTPARISCYQQADCAWLCEIPGNDARAETVAFCAAMLAMAVTVDDCSTGAQCCPFLR